MTKRLPLLRDGGAVRRGFGRDVEEWLRVALVRLHVGDEVRDGLRAGHGGGRSRRRRRGGSCRLLRVERVLVRRELLQLRDLQVRLRDETVEALLLIAL